MEERKNYVKKMKGLSKALSIVSKVLKVFVIIGGCFSIFAMVIIPMLFKNITISENEIKVKDTSIIAFKENDGKLEVSLLGKFIIMDSDLVEIKEVTKIFNNKSKNLFLAYVEALLFVSIVTLAILYMVLNYIDKLFKNIETQDSPFTLENSLYIKKCGYYLIALVAVPLVLSGIFEMISGTELMFTWNTVEILLILVVFAMSYVFEYGYDLENKKSNK